MRRSGTEKTTTSGDRLLGTPPPRHHERLRLFCACSRQAPSAVPPTTPQVVVDCVLFQIPIAASLILLHGTYWSFLWGLIFFQVFSVLDGCDGEIARAKFLESESGRRLDDLFDILSNILLVVGLGFGLSQQANE